MTDVKEIAKWLFWGLVGALWLYCAQFDLPFHTKVFLYVIGLVTASFSIGSLLARIPLPWSRTTRPKGGDPRQEGLGEVPEGDEVSASAERGSHSVSGGPASQE